MSSLSEPLKPVQKEDQVAALMLLVFEANPNTVMTRRDVESMLDLDGFSLSTRWRALNVLCTRKHIRYKNAWPEKGTGPTTYWLNSEVTP